MATKPAQEVSSESALPVPSISDLDSVWYSPESIVDRSLLEPTRQFLTRPRKGFRAQLVHAGFLFSGEAEERALTSRDLIACERLSDALEAIHAGSLIVDDIQDGSRERRGKPPLHDQLGMPLALNAGNWLYFQPFEWIRELALGDDIELRLYRLCHETMLQAHVGQAIDLGTKIDEVPKENVEKICARSLALKTGALLALALGCGAVLARASEERLKSLQRFGVEFGMALQMFDDIGNSQLPTGHPKRFEDLALRRPTWLWSAASRSLSDRDYKSFVNAVRRLPNDKMFTRFMVKHELAQSAYVEADDFLIACMSRLEDCLRDLALYPQGHSNLKSISERIRTSYGC